MISLQEKPDFEALARLAAEPGNERFLAWVSGSRDQYLDLSMQADQSRDERISHLDKAQVLNEMLETVGGAHETLRSWPAESDENPPS